MLPIYQGDNMRVINNGKERIRIYLRNDIESSITNITSISNEIQNILAALNDILGGSLMENDLDVMGNCQKILQNLSSALQQLNKCYGIINRIDITEEIADE